MSAFNKASKKGLDWISLALYFSLLIIGWLMLYAAFYEDGSSSQIFNLNSNIGKQSLWTIISILAFFAMLVIDWKFWFSSSYFIYVGCIILLLAVLIFGTEIKGARSWFSLGGLSFQPSEFAKLATALALASYLSMFNTKLSDSKSLAISLSLLAAPAFLIALQPDPGSAIIFSGFLIVLYRQGMNPLYFIIGFSLLLIFILSLIYSPSAVILGVLLTINSILLFNYRSRSKYFLILIPILWVGSYYVYLNYTDWYMLVFNLLVFIYLAASQFLSRKLKTAPFFALVLVLSSAFSFGSKYAFDNFLEKHQQDRINVWLRPDLCDPQGSLYNIIQSKLAIGSGGVQGKGFLKGTMTKLNYVPEQSTDFIFSIVGEEQGFIGSLGIISIYLLLLIRLTIMAERAKNEFITCFMYGVAGLLFVHIFINISMTMGLMPVIGIPLPFLSKGGTALLSFSIMLGMVIKMDLARYR